MDRRTFVRSAAAATGCGALLTACASLPYVAGTPGSRGIEVSTAALAELDFALVEVPGREYPVFLSRDGRDYRAVSTRCTHRGCTVKPAGQRLECPCHGSRFAFDGKRIDGPAPSGLQAYEVIPGAETMVILVGEG